MEEKVGAFASTAVLKASTHIREEICGAVKQKVEHSGSLETLTDEQLHARYLAVLEKAKTEIPQEAGPTELAVAKEGADLGPEGETNP